MSRDQGAGSPLGPVVLLTDFGESSWYTGVMKGVILRILPSASIVDLSHSVSPQDISEGEFILRNSISYFPEGAVFVCVVDPGVGGARRGIAVDTGDYIFTGPDNGLLTAALDRPGARTHEIGPGEYTIPARGCTFHGRDIFAPAGAHLAGGVPVERMGYPVDAPVRLERPETPVDGEDGLWGRVIHIDSYGNMLTDISEEMLLNAFGECERDMLSIEAGDFFIHGVRDRYEQEEPGGLMALINSWGCLEISVNMGEASGHPAFEGKTPGLIRVFLQR